MYRVGCIVDNLGIIMVVVVRVTDVFRKREASQTLSVLTAAGAAAAGATSFPCIAKHPL